MGISSDKKLPKSQKEKIINEEIKLDSNSENKNHKKEKEGNIKNIEIINLLKTVKSKFIIKKIFSCLEENMKLTIIVHNKKFQNLFGLDTIYYKNKIGKSRIIEKNGICKEYTLKNILIFEGEFKNGKKNGNAKEFDNYDGKVSFEGTYLNGKRNGKGKEYSCLGYLKFDGEYLNGYKIEGKGYNDKGKLIFELERNGKGKEYYDNGNLKFEGEYLNEKKNGKGKSYYKNGKLEIEGEYKFDKLNGKVKKYDEYGELRFDGEYKNGNKWNGKEKDVYFQGEYLNGKRWDGKGSEFENVKLGPTDFRTIKAFEGEYINGKKKGKREIYDRKSKTCVLKEIDEENDIKSDN